MATQHFTIPMRGMTCGVCVSQIEQALRAQTGIIWATVNFAAEEATVIADPAVFGLPKTARLLRDQGYDVPLPDGRGSQSTEQRTSRMIRHDHDYSSGSKHMLIMVLCCAAPIVALAAISFLRIPLTGVLSVAVTLLCPLGMLFVMTSMMGHSDHSPAETTPRHLTTEAQSPAEHDH